MDKIRLLIADHDARFTEYVVNALKMFPEIELLGVETDGINALERVKQSKPDTLLFDLLLPGLDGISLLKNVNELSSPPVTLCCTRFYSDVAMEAIRAYGASYILYKPIDANALHTSIVSSTHLRKKMLKMNHAMLTQNADNDKLRLYIRNYIVGLGIPSKLLGCTYLTEAVLLAKRDITLIRNLSHGLYHEISQIMRTTPSCVERSIRNAISNAYSDRNLPDHFFQCPSNKEFIQYILQNFTL